MLKGREGGKTGSKRKSGVVEKVAAHAVGRWGLAGCYFRSRVGCVCVHVNVLLVSARFCETLAMVAEPLEVRTKRKKNHSYQQWQWRRQGRKRAGGRGGGVWWYL